MPNHELTAAEELLREQLGVPVPSSAANHYRPCGDNGPLITFLALDAQGCLARGAFAGLADDRASARSRFSNAQDLIDRLLVEVAIKSILSTVTGLHLTEDPGDRSDELEPIIRNALAEIGRSAVANQVVSGMLTLLGLPRL
jgi:hypothetical protein